MCNVGSALDFPLIHFLKIRKPDGKSESWRGIKLLAEHNEQDDSGFHLTL